jgi:hypothetical protein
VRRPAFVRTLTIAVLVPRDRAFPEHAIEQVAHLLRRERLDAIV